MGGESRAACLIVLALVLGLILGACDLDGTQLAEENAPSERAPVIRSGSTTEHQISSEEPRQIEILSAEGLPVAHPQRPAPQPQAQLPAPQPSRNLTNTSSQQDPPPALPRKPNFDLPGQNYPVSSAPSTTSLPNPEADKTQPDRSQEGDISTRGPSEEPEEGPLDGPADEENEGGGEGFEDAITFETPEKDDEPPKYDQKAKVIKKVCRHIKCTTPTKVHDGEITFRVEIQVFKTGKHEVNLLEGSGCRNCDRITLRCLRAWRWEPAVKDNLKVDSKVRFRHTLMTPPDYVAPAFRPPYPE